MYTSYSKRTWATEDMYTFVSIYTSYTSCMASQSYVPPPPQSVPSPGSTSSKPPVFSTFFRVQYYVENALTDLKLRETRHQLYLQLRKDTVGKLHYFAFICKMVHLLFFWATSQELCSKLLPYTEGKMYCHEESALKLAAYALQAEKGDHQPTYKNKSYFRLEDYVPEKVSPRNKFTRLAAKTGPF